MTSLRAFTKDIRGVDLSCHIDNNVTAVTCVIFESWTFVLVLGYR